MNDDGKVRWIVTTYKWTMDGKKPKRLEYFSQNQDGEIYNQHYYEFTETRKVKQSRNCDAFGFEVWLGI